jgi:PIN domain nuclease of toxin-antitoxin system
VAVKQSIGKLDKPADLPERIRDSGFRTLDITAEHAIVAGRLPLIHRDPFDRMLIAQAQVEHLTLVTRDAEIPKYNIASLAA